MDTRMQSIMALAFHPNTGDGEAIAAFMAARRLAGNRGIDAVVVERVVTREVVKEVNRKTSWERGVRYRQCVPARWQHDFLLTILQAARRLDLDLEVDHLGTVDNRVIGALEITYAVRGTAGAVGRFDALVEAYTAEMRKRS